MLIRLVRSTTKPQMGFHKTQTLKRPKQGGNCSHVSQDYLERMDITYDGLIEIRNEYCII